MGSGMDIGIVGGGLGGLVAAIAFAQAGHTVRVFERRKTPVAPEGGVISLRTSALQILYRLGLKEKLLAIGEPLGESQLRDLATGAVLKTVYLADSINPEKNNELSLVTSRPKLAEMFYEAALAAGAAVTLGVEVVTVTEQIESATVALADGSIHKADLVLVSDGIKSRLRASILSDVEPSHLEPILTDYTAYTSSAPIERIPPRYKRDLLQTNGPWGRIVSWQGNHLHAMNFASEGDNRVLISFTIGEPVAQTSRWNDQGDLQYVRGRFKDHAAPDVLEALSLVDYCDRWQTAYLPKLPRWTSIRQDKQRGRIALLGDAAHAVLPITGAGITITIEEIGALAYLVANRKNLNTPRLLDLWENICKPRADRVGDMGLFTMRRMHGDAEAVAEAQKVWEEESQQADRRPVADMSASFSSKDWQQYMVEYDAISATQKALAAMGG